MSTPLNKQEYVNLNLLINNGRYLDPDKEILKVENVRLSSKGNTLNTKLFHTFDNLTYLSHAILKYKGWSDDGSFEYEIDGISFKEIDEVRNKYLLNISTWKQYEIDTEDYKYNACMAFVTRDHKLFLLGSRYDGYEYFPYQEITNALPNNELVFKAILGWVNIFILTLKGNFYVYSIVNKTTTFITSNITDFSSSGAQSNYLITSDGKLLHHWVNTNTIYEVEGITDAKQVGYYNNTTLFDKVVCITHSGEIYMVFDHSVMHKYDMELPEDAMITNSVGWDAYIVCNNNENTYKTYDTVNDETGEITFNIIDRNFKFLDINTDTMPPYIDIPIDYQTIDYTSNTYTNLNYKIRFGLDQNISVDGTRNVVNYVALFL